MGSDERVDFFAMPLMILTKSHLAGASSPQTSGRRQLLLHGNSLLTSWGSGGFVIEGSRLVSWKNRNKPMTKMYFIPGRTVKPNEKYVRVPSPFSCLQSLPSVTSWQTHALVWYILVISITCCRGHTINEHRFERRHCREPLFRVPPESGGTRGGTSNQFEHAQMVLKELFAVKPTSRVGIMRFGAWLEDNGQ
ncbi:hypothetical protein JTE90_022206 [Oedothorax gibbosus]|uniref:Uncharacterized protein n=1 Tax=Oedothorax gibbosus TaxID=931172 RepID=A0AAV6VSK7_9ARAC|nr:hypothetical protein JTE90_022206 [Oedothorax gibbosus]